MHCGPTVGRDEHKTKMDIAEFSYSRKECNESAELQYEVKEQGRDMVICCSNRQVVGALSY